MTPHELAKILREGTTDYDVVIDLNSAFARLPKQHREFLCLYSSGFSVRGAAQKMQLRNNPQRLFNSLITRILREVNGDAKDSINRTNVQRQNDSSGDA